jgi:molecular chaperone GrpE (heat shock protein)
MNDAERLESIRKKSGTGLTAEDVAFLLSRISELEKKNAVLSRHVLELTEEMENVRMDFGGGNR